MKTISILILSLTLFSSYKLTAQDWKIGGNILSSNGSFGSNNNFSVIFKTNNTERGRITNGGNWGIGTGSPLSKLSVNSASGASPFQAQINGATQLIVAGNGNVGIGTATPLYKLQVEGKVSISNGLVVSGSSDPGVYGSSAGTGVYGKSTGSGTNSIGVYGSGGYIGVNGSGFRGVNGTGTNIGVNGYGNDFGLYGSANSSSGTGVHGSGKYGLYGYGSAYGIYAWGHSYGVYGNTDYGWGGYFNGDVYSTHYYEPSDRNLKQNIEEFSDALNIINKLKPKHYEYRHDGNFANLNLPSGKHYGLIAQELEEVLPNLVKEASHPLSHVKPQQKEPSTADEKMPTVTTVQKEMNGETQATETINIKAVNYTELVPILVKAMQEQQQQIEELTNEVSSLKQLVNKLTNGRNPSFSLSGAALGHVSPNPVKSSANIPISLPEGVNRAVLLITDNLGRTIRQIPITASGIVNIDASNLSSGIYNYSLLVDHKNIATQKMTVIR